MHQIDGSQGVTGEAAGLAKSRKSDDIVRAWEAATGEVVAIVAIALTAYLAPSILTLLVASTAGTVAGYALARRVLQSDVTRDDQDRLPRGIATITGYVIGIVVGMVLWPLSIDPLSDPQTLQDVARWMIVIAAAGSTACVIFQATRTPHLLND
jgi:hypothetical protein